MNTMLNARTVETAPIARLARDVLGLFKLRIGFMIMVTALVGLAVTPGPAPGGFKVLVLAFAVLVASASAGAFNQYYERDGDRLMARTRGRPFVTGALPYSPWWLLFSDLPQQASANATLAEQQDVDLRMRKIEVAVNRADSLRRLPAIDDAGDAARGRALRNGVDQDPATTDRAEETTGHIRPGSHRLRDERHQ